MAYVDRLLGKNETIIFTTRQHASILAVPVLVGLLVVALLVALGFLLKTFWVILLLPVPFLYFLYRVFDWSARVFLVTNRRAIEVEGLLSKRSKDSSLDKINDVMLEQSLMGRMFNYGDVEILTASEEGISKLRRIADPITFKKHMLNQKEGMRSAEGAAPPKAAGPSPASTDLTKRIEELDALRKKGLLTDEEFAAKKKDLLSRL